MAYDGVGRNGVPINGVRQRLVEASTVEQQLYSCTKFAYASYVLPYAYLLANMYQTVSF